MSIDLLYKMAVGYNFTYKFTTNVYHKWNGYWWIDGKLKR